MKKKKKTNRSLSKNRQKADAPLNFMKKEKPQCGLCGKQTHLVKTPCCGNWICDDADQYVPFSYARNSCYVNHARHTLCGYHYNERHAGDWKTCESCRKSIETEMYVYYGTNEYNFTVLENPPKFKPTYCSECGNVIRLSEGGYTLDGDAYVCGECSFADFDLSIDDEEPPESDDFNPHLQTTMIEAVDDQLRNNDPPKTRETFDRLKKLGYSDIDAKKLIASALVVEIYDIMKHNKTFNRERFLKNLGMLPDLSFLGNE